MRKEFLKKGIAGVLAGVLCTTLLFPGDVAQAKGKKLDPNGTYHAALGLQTCTQVWINRFAYYDKESNKYYGTEDAAKMFAGDPSRNGADYACEFEDAEIKGNGTYTVKVTGADFAGETDISQLHVATDIPMNDTIKFTDVSFSVNGKKIATFDEGYMEDEEPYINGGMDLLLLNGWRDPLVDELENKGLTKKKSGYNLLNGSGKESISVTFTVTGFNYNYGETPSKEKAYVMPKVTVAGNTKAIKGITYKVTKSDKAKGTVAVVKHKKSTSVTIPQTIKWNTYTFQVTEISANAFAKDQKLKKVVIEKNVKRLVKMHLKAAKILRSLPLKPDS